MSDKIPYRQIHLDFHTSPEIPGVGERFDAEEFARTLTDAHVNSINLFTKCHHGMYYYPTKIGTMHPSLKFDLFGEQVRACRKHGIRAMAYTCVAWNEDWANRHPESLCVTWEGVRGNKKPFEDGFYKWNSLCISQPGYRDILKAEFREVWENYHPDGFWIDIVCGYECVCPVCQKEMKAMGLDPTDREQVRRHDRMAEISFCREMYGYLKDLDPSLEIYFNSHPYALDNGLDAETSSRTKRNYFSFLDIESLPSDMWGYSHFPIAASYVGKYDFEICMMNGKFHLSWGDFGSLRNQEALEYECFRALAYGARVCVGDQLHPCGRLDPEVYRRIGAVFAEIEKKEPWLRGTRRVCDVGVFLTGDSNDPNAPRPTEEGVYRVLSELHIPFDFLNSIDPLDSYRLLILPDFFQPDQDLVKRLEAFVQGGGQLLMTGSSGVAAGTGNYPGFIKAKFRGVSENTCRYLRLDRQVFPDIPPIDHVLYEQGFTAESEDQSLAEIIPPYFNRTYDHFSSHRQTAPMLNGKGESGIFRGDGYLCITSPLFSDYCKNGYQVHREILRQCIGLLYRKPLICTDLPSITELTVRESSKAFLVHLLNYTAQRRCKRLDTIEEKYHVPSAELSLRMEQGPASVRLVPEGTSLPFSWKDGYVTIPLREISGHTMIEILKR